MAATKPTTRNKGKKPTKRRYIGKPSGVIQQRVQDIGPQHFGVIAVDCAKRRSKWMLCDYFGRVIVEPTIVEHNAGALKAMVAHVTAACEAEGIRDSIVGVEMTGVYHKPVQAAFRKAGYDTPTTRRTIPIWTPSSTPPSMDTAWLSFLSMKPIAPCKDFVAIAAT